MLKHFEITRARLQAFVKELRPLLYSQVTPVKLEAYAAPGRIRFEEAVKAKYNKIECGHHFAPLWSTHWVKVTAQIPRQWKNKEVHFLWDSVSEACIWEEGTPRQGLTGSDRSEFPIRPQYKVAERASGGEKISFFIEVACNGLFGIAEFGTKKTAIGKLKQAELAVFEREAWELYWDFVIVADMACYLSPELPRAGQALAVANSMVNVFRVDDKDTWVKARQLAARFLAEKNGDAQHNLSAVGHAHIDTAWLWPIAETKRKCVRTFSTALRMMEEYPEYRFACSQAQQLQWIKDEHPKLFSEIKKQAHRGKFVPTGGTWVEPDCNIPSGESLVRQFLYGQRFFKKEFGAYCTEFWNPDVFGYSAALPQIMRGAGIKYFLTQKLSWNQFNKPASTTFVWRGLDGSDVLTHFPPAGTYNSLANVEQVLQNVRGFKDHERARESYLLFGYGDGGGGPTTEMLEQLKRMKDTDGLPRVTIRTPTDFFKRCESDFKDKITWVGELYFELHRGTYTTQAKTKLLNRRCEEALRKAEMLAAFAARLDKKYKYPKKDLEDAWKKVLTNQFHDIIPGSSIGEVYEDAERDYREVLETAEHVSQVALGAITKVRSKNRPGRDSEGVNSFTVFNPVSYARREIVELSKSKVNTTTRKRRDLVLVETPGSGLYQTTPLPKSRDTVTVAEKRSGFVLENPFVRVEISKSGALLSYFYKKNNREIMATGSSGNRFVIYDDKPLRWDAWDIDVFHQEKFEECTRAHSAKIVEKNALRVTLEFVKSLGSASELVQRISLCAHSPRLDFFNEIEWAERHKLLKVEFDTTLKSNNASFEIQFGHVERPTHYNTSWDMARFEVCGARFADLSEPDFGVALLNNCKYGYSIHNGTMRLSLLRAPLNPDPSADQGRHEFAFALFPHCDRLEKGGVIAEAACFNEPLEVCSENSNVESIPFIDLNSPAIALSAVKQSEEGDATVLRVYESFGTHVSGQIKVSGGFKVFEECNLLEESISKPKKLHGNQFEVTLRPFEIKTFRLS